MQPPPPVLVEVADATAQALGSRAPHDVTAHWDASKGKRVDIVRYEGHPVGDARTFATIGLSQRALRDPELRMELVAGVRASVSGFDRVVATVAFNIMDIGQAFPDQVHTDAVGMYYPGCTTPHALLAIPGMWGDAFTVLHTSAGPVAWLQPIPITVPELDYASAHGFGALDKAYRGRPFDPSDLYRESVV
ncbi:suppressor of fused domain protein [Phytomonospora endophytica]|uniref:Suppressor of fused-like domain-containing protein n=1 Tax=Phytomonospora endophytica TaxID=714109 RepID=A0A841FK16_9ACTN|nr:suppressor of fused domain protein [Phytomonospora endophytica]MBB6032979.1 hypothetical protein [Phytomonospora endophytica]GIG65205.1 hypothetical protein Pen01_15000 [Phytomonospora endophytica]